MCHTTQRGRSRAASRRLSRQSCWHCWRWWLVEYVPMHVRGKNMCDWLRSRACQSTGDCWVWRRVAGRGPPLERPSTQRWLWWRPRKNESVAGFRREQSQIYRDWGKGVMTAQGVQGSDTIFKTMDLTEKIGWGKRNVKLWVINKLLLRNRDSGSNRSNRGGLDAEKKRTENRTLENTRGNMSRCRGVISDGDRSRAIGKMGFNPMIDLYSIP